MHFWTEA